MFPHEENSSGIPDGRNEHAATLTGGAVRFTDAKFTGAAVSFTEARFSGGTVDFRNTDDWSCRPRFDWADDAEPPAGVMFAGV